ncbi:Protein of unknown function DUF128 [Methanothermus fervidus DSM 2088]|uniref:Uncharacterized protein n=1 Tax=Methanothermus fervidus (strain ATCC 43054 / DSM 2088 / JCM 10308 / V24 S) TaxID=523846 RepID=E3GY38_METFV|nr:DUF128 domain-containing protein [Methanothermus fervidus]ADP77220.1 Protein of unknown function DUF128 [Methanothermus fervidus DSM 2088]
MFKEFDKKLLEILRILAEHNEVLGARAVARELKERGYDIGERAVRYHMRILDERGLTKRIGYSGRKITKKGLKEVERGLVYDQVDFIFSRFENMMYETTLNPKTGEGKVVVNISVIPSEAFNMMKKIFHTGLCVSPKVGLNKKNGKYEVKTICGTTVDGMLLNEGIPVIPKFGGLVEVEDFRPIKFTELIEYKKTSMTPLEAFATKELTSVLDVVNEGKGKIPANFRIIPKSAKEKAINLFKKLRKIGINGLLKIGEKKVLGVPVDDGMIGIAIVGGITPICAVHEAGYDIDIKVAEDLTEFKNLKTITQTNPILKKSKKEKGKKIVPLLTKVWNLIGQVDLDIKKLDGKVIANLSTIDKKYLNDALEIFQTIIDEKPEYSVFPSIKLKERDNKVDIATVCSLTIDGVLINNGIMSVPRYGGLLEIKNNKKRFVELIDYSGSSFDPHEIYISKNMTKIYRSSKTSTILASLREIPYLARNKALKVIKKLKKANFQIMKVGKTNEILYNAKVERYRVGIVTPGGLNLIAALKENGIKVNIKSAELLMDINEFSLLDDINF